MGGTQVLTESPSLTLHMEPVLRRMKGEEFYEFCRQNPDWRFEQTVEGDLVVMPPTGGGTGKRNFTLMGLFHTWVVADGRGVGFDSSTAFTLPNGAVRSPDLSWVRKERWGALSKAQQERFPPLCPDFVVELRSPSDDLDSLQAKMREYVANGAQLGWLIDPEEKKLYVHRPATVVTCLDDPEWVSGEPVLPGFRLEVRRLWT